MTDGTRNVVVEPLLDCLMRLQWKGVWACGSRVRGWSARVFSYACIGYLASCDRFERRLKV